MRLMIRLSKACNSPSVGAREAWNTATPSVGRIDPIEYQAVQMDVQISGRAETLDEGNGAGAGLGALESRLFNQQCRYGPVDDLPKSSI
jgi:hypothetical protein